MFIKIGGTEPRLTKLQEKGKSISNAWEILTSSSSLTARFVPYTRNTQGMRRCEFCGGEFEDSRIS